MFRSEKGYSSSMSTNSNSISCSYNSKSRALKPMNSEKWMGKDLHKNSELNLHPTISQYFKYSTNINKNLSKEETLSLTQRFGKIKFIPATEIISEELQTLKNDFSQSDCIKDTEKVLISGSFSDIWTKPRVFTERKTFVGISSPKNNDLIDSAQQNKRFSSVESPKNKNIRAKAHRSLLYSENALTSRAIDNHYFRNYNIASYSDHMYCDYCDKNMTTTILYRSEEKL